MHAEHDPDLTSDQRRLAANVRNTLEESPLDAVTQARLSAARHRALSTVRASSRLPLWAGAALAAGLILAVSLSLQPAAVTPPGLPLDEDSLEWLALTTETPEVYEELEYYEWLNSNTDAS